MDPVLERSMRIEASSARAIIASAEHGGAIALPERFLQARSAHVSCRILNLAIAVIALLLSLPLMLLIAIAIKLTSRGPVLYAQTRVGLDRRGRTSSDIIDRRTVDYGGRLFTIYKFRTMRPAEGAALQIWAAPNDSRVTRVGGVLRKYRLDELPQFWNVVKGDMNVVGPRPEQPNIFLTLRQQIPGYDRRQRVLPGITGLAQVSQHYDQNVDDVRRKLAFDLEYINQQKLTTDLMILARTVPTVLFRRGAW